MTSLVKKVCLSIAGLMGKFEESCLQGQLSPSFA